MMLKKLYDLLNGFDRRQKRIESRIECLLADERHGLSFKQQEDIRSYYLAGEHFLAFEFFVDALVEAEREVDPAVLTKCEILLSEYSAKDGQRVRQALNYLMKSDGLR